MSKAKEQILTGKQRKFIDSYLGDARFNATQAARLAGYSGNDVTLGAVGAENLKKPQIAEAIQMRLKEAQMSADEVLSELADVARADWREFVTIKWGKEGEKLEASLRLADKLKALELVGKAHKLFTDKVEHSGDETQPLEILIRHVKRDGTTNRS
jgi:phage terminase small subunit